MGRASLKKHGYLERLGAYAWLFILLDAVFLTALVYYRLRASFVFSAVAADSAVSVSRAGYLLPALASDALAAAAGLSVLSLLWLLCPFLRGFAAALSAAFTGAASGFLILTVDFARVYQSAFRKSYIGGEHLTGLGSMLKSALSELSPSSMAVIAAFLFAIAVACALSSGLGKLPFWALKRTTFSHARSSGIAAIALGAFFLLGWPKRFSGSADGESMSAGEAERAGKAAIALSSEYAPNPLCALAFGPERKTFMPVDIAKPASAFYDTDSIELSDADRPLPAATKKRLNVILYFFESMSWRYYDLQRGGKYVVPNMRALAQKGLLLSEHYSTYPLSANTLYTVLSSRYSMYGKAMIFREYHDVDVGTLPEVLSRAGYATCFVHSGDLLYAARDQFLANREIDSIIIERDLQKEASYPGKVGWGADERAMIGPALRWIEGQEAPYLLMVSPVSPHHPYAIPKDFPEFVDADEEGIGEGERNFRAYLNSLHYADAAMGQFVESLESRGLMEDALFVMVTDHGEAFYQHKGNYNHPLLVYEENVHVPALFYSPSAIPAQAPYASVTRHVDLLPSILDLIGVADSGHRDGESIFSASKEKMAIFHTSWTDEYMGVRDGKWKYIKRMKDAREELYDLSADPWEKEDLSAENAAITERYREEADGMVAYMIDQYASIARKPSPVPLGGE